MKIQAGRLRLILDASSGAFERIEDRSTGLVHVRANPDRFLFRVTVPRGIWATRYVDNTSAPPRITRAGEGGYVLAWNNLPAADGPSGVDVEMRVEPVPAGNEIRFVTTVTNRGADTVTEVCAPAVAGWTGIGGKGRDRLVCGGHVGRDPHRFPEK